MKKTPSKVAHNRPKTFFSLQPTGHKSAQISYFFHKNGSLRDFYIMTFLEDILIVPWKTERLEWKWMFHTLVILLSLEKVEKKSTQLCLRQVAIFISQIQTKPIPIRRTTKLPLLVMWNIDVLCQMHSLPLIHCTALHCTALHCTALLCSALHCTALHCTA